MFSKILIANRGEIACRVITACRELKVPCVAVYSEADRAALHVSMADEARCIGPARNRDSYLNMPAIIQTALMTECDAIHPGYGNLSEDASFAEICETYKIKFIGPPAHVIEAMGDKSAARRAMREHGVPVVPGTEDGIANVSEARSVARGLGYPVYIKAAAGGGGRGIRLVQNEEDLGEAVEMAQAEARAAFGNPAVYMERQIPEPRHIEVQILADSHDNVVHLGERECSIQFRLQKLLEESPSPGVKRSSLRRRLGDAAVRAAKAIGYQNAGTVEFLLDSRGQFFFIEMNTRVQVEHPVTEMITGVDIVKEQIRIAAGERLSCEQGRIYFQGHAIECRILAADGFDNFLPSAGKITEWVPPSGPGVRVDTGVRAGSVIPTNYDPMIAKVICWNHDRPSAISRMEAALRSMHIGGIDTTIDFHLALLKNAYFRRGEIDTSFIRRRMNGEGRRYAEEGT
ncbi:MAG: acetyl-CoA carboxylase biotin carboxylase subunit [Armatimonadota bacterium]|jgi:acetyl-CoA carboxylase biotin carboxylase subunit